MDRSALGGGAAKRGTKYGVLLRRYRVNNGHGPWCAGRRAFAAARRFIMAMGRSALGGGRLRRLAAS